MTELVKVEAFQHKGSNYEFFQGKAKWVRVHKINEWGKWTVVLYPNSKSLERIRELQGEGLKNLLKKDEDGYYTTISRPSTKLIKGKVVAFAPVIVIDIEGKEFLGVVGNGSDVTLKTEVYSHPTPGGGRAKAIRLVAIRIDHLVPYEAPKFEKEQVSGLSDQPEQLF